MAKDNIWNGVILGAVIGVLIASSEISFITSIVDFVMKVIPEQYATLTYMKYIVFGVVGGIVGAIVDRY